MFSLDGRNAAFLGGATAAFLAGVYVLWGPSEKKTSRRKKDLCPGLVNLGNTCFLNSLLQAVAPCTSVVQWLKDFLQYNKDIAVDSKSLANTLSHSLEVLNNESVEYTDEFNPDDILGALRMKRWHISSDQQDAHELYHVFTETLEEEAAKYPTVLPLFDVQKIENDIDYQTEKTAQSRSKTLLPVLPSRGSDQPFRGLLASQLQCTKCTHKCSVKYDTFDSLSLSIPSPHMQGVLTLEYLLRRYVTSETVQNVECDGCAQLPRRRSSVQKLLNMENSDDAPKPKTTFVKKLTIGKLPACLCVHVQRLTWLDNGMPLKRFDHIAFPETLSMDSYVYQKRPTRPSTLDITDNRKGLIGGKTALHGDCNGNKRKTPTPSPTVTSPYSGPVNLLKALNYTSRTTMNGLFVQPPVTTPTPISRQSPVPSRSNSQVQRLTRAYSMEMAGIADNNNAYKLTSVVVHLGDVDSGHFITYRRAVSDNGQRFPDKWLYTSDTEVKKVSLSTVLQADAYMLFYERV